jgi:predicted secreted acid phosphatase
MRVRGKGLARSAALLAVGAVLGGAVLAVAAKKPLVPAKPAPDPAHSIRETGVGLPRIGSQGTLGIGEFAQSVRNYHDSGSYASDLQAVDSQAQSFMQRQTKALRGRAKRRCNAAKRNGVKGGKRRRACKRPNLAIVLDIDETSLSNYEELNGADFSNAEGALVLALGSADSPAIAPTLALYQRARRLGIAVFAVTGRPPFVADLTRQNLNRAGYTDLAGLYLKPSGEATIAFKSASRAAIEQAGYRIVANIGDQESDLSGGHADRTYKLPNPFYFIA